MKDVIDDIYAARSSADYKDLAFLVLKFGGPSLLDILYRANKLPSTSTAYRISRKCQKLICPVNMPQYKCMENNIKINCDEEDKWTFSLKQDETVVNPKLRFNSIDNNIVGICYQHGKEMNLQFDDITTADSLKSKIEKGEVHVPKDMLVTGLNSISNCVPLQIVSALPSCSKNKYWIKMFV